MSGFTDRQKQINTMDNHFEKWDLIANEFGIESLLEMMPYSKEKLTELYDSGDTHFNKTQLIRWDNYHCFIGGRMRHINGWGTLSDTVCVLKHVARYYFVGVDRPE